MAHAVAHDILFLLRSVSSILFTSSFNRSIVLTMVPLAGRSRGISRISGNSSGSGRGSGRGSDRRGRGSSSRGRRRCTGSLQRQIVTCSKDRLIQGSTMGSYSSRHSGNGNGNGNVRGECRGNANGRGSMIIPGSLEEHSSVSSFTSSTAGNEE
jgi:hypothetical protein